MMAISGNAPSAPSAKRKKSDPDSPKPKALTTANALKVFDKELTAFEKTEITAFDGNIYCIGSKAEKLNVDTFTTPDGYYSYVKRDHINYRYELSRLLGAGEYAQVFKAFDHCDGVFVALKIFKNLSQSREMAEREYNLLKQLNNADPEHTANVVRVNELFVFRRHPVMVQEVLFESLFDFLKINKFPALSDHVVRAFARSIHRALLLLAEKKIIHGDLKPENLVLRQPGKTGVKLVDFGTSCPENQRIFTYIQSRFYRAPEVVLGLPYGLPIDMWSLGCVLVELFTGHPLFMEQQEIDLFARMIEIRGLPPQEMVQECEKNQPRLFKQHFLPGGSPRYLADAENVHQNSENPRPGPPGTRALREILGNGATQESEDFILRCLEWDPVQRITPKEAQEHPWFVGHNTSPDGSVEQAPKE